ncbi:hypothetical protein Rt10032_c01g0090 [Rhodotorula toruloides]|uniref:Uncharacterized protein n=1 Tax=Rhodotorula toruloides TaxID=5286 RepID=A0A511K6V5_RHOTO|nr:hypothetical protein Rt10032_c01g0090 [Rhodotorula toruloides]
MLSFFCIGASQVFYLPVNLRNFCSIQSVLKPREWRIYGHERTAGAERSKSDGFRRALRSTASSVARAESKAGDVDESGSLWVFRTSALVEEEVLGKVARSSPNEAASGTASPFALFMDDQRESFAVAHPLRQSR